MSRLSIAATRETVCVTGANGGLGRALLEQLAELYHVKALFREANECSRAWEARGCTIVTGDLDDEAALSELVRGALYVFHCAAIVGRASYADAHAVNVEGTRRLARLAAEHRCSRFVHVSSIAVYMGAEPDGDYGEDTAIAAREDMAVYGLTKLESEQALVAVAQEYGLEYVIIRPTSIYGPHTKTHTTIPVEMISKGVPSILGNGHGILDVVYVDDVARALVLAARTAAAAGHVFNIGRDAVTLNDFNGYYERMLNRRARHLPLGVIRVVLMLLAFLPGARATPRRELWKGVRLLLTMATNSRRFPHEKAKELLGFSPEVSLPIGMLKTELWLKDESLVSPQPYSLKGYGLLPFRPTAVVHPTTEAELVQIVQIAARREMRVRAIGSLHSQCAVPYTEGICVVLDAYNKLVGVAGSLVTVQAGLILRDLNELLAELNLALPTSGAITAQTITGSISTGTHGGSVVRGALGDYVESVRIVTADGRVVEIDRSQEAFQALIVSCGLFGIISTVTIRCPEAFVLQSRSSVWKAQDVVERFDEINRGSLYTCLMYFPVTDQVEVLSIDKSSSATVDAPTRAGLPKGPRSRVGVRVRELLARNVVRVVAWLLHRHVALHRYLTSFSVGSAYPVRTDRSDRVLAMTDVGTTGRSRALLQDMEIAVSYEHAPAAIEALRSHFAATRQYPILPIHIRCSSRSEQWLSPAYGRDVCFLEFWQYPPTEGLFDRIHEVMKPFGYRFHWGKETRADRDYISQQYDRWNDFARLRQEWDPRRMFLNTYLEPFFPDVR